MGALNILRRVRGVRPTGNSASIYVVAETSMPYRDLLRIANAKKVKFLLNRDKYDLTRENHEAIRDLASRTIP